MREHIDVTYALIASTMRLSDTSRILYDSLNIDKASIKKLQIEDFAITL